MQETFEKERFSAELLTAITDATPLPMIVIGRDERILAANSAARAMFTEAMVGQLYVAVLRQPILLDAIENVLRLSQPAAAIYRIPQNQREVVYDVSVRPIRADDFACVSIMFEDRTALQEASQMRRDFVANVSHELRTPLTALLGFIETLMGPAANDEKARLRFLDVMDREAKRMNRIVGDLLSLSRVEEDRRVRPTDDVDISAIIRSVALSLAPLAEKNDVTVVIEGADTEETIPGDFDQLTQVMTNLMENAIKYGGKGNEVRVCLTSHTEEPTMRGPAVRVDVSDQGDGIPTQHIPRLTERFYRVDSHRSREMGGTGLGLAIVKHILNRHRGRLRVESHPGQGSLFSVILPHE